MDEKDPHFVLYDMARPKRKIFDKFGLDPAIDKFKESKIGRDKEKLS